MYLRFFGRSDTGRRRTSNEDSYILCEEEGLAVVCDGMGGHHAGEIASRTAVDLFAEKVIKYRAVLHDPKLKLSQSRARARQLIERWTEEINAEIHALGKAENTDGSFKSRMGTTLALVLFVSDFIVVAHVGDSRVYRVRHGEIKLLTEDHTIVADDKKASPDNPRKRKYVTRALGTKKEVEPDVNLHDVYAGDVYVLTSDGLTDLVDESEILSIVLKAGVERRREAVRQLIRLANKRGGVDNITVVLTDALGHGRDEDDDEDTEDLPLA